MTRHNRSATIGAAIFAMVLSCFTRSSFAQSPDQFSDQSSDRDSQSAECCSKNHGSALIPNIVLKRRFPPTS
jgi:hypothetical protein